MNSLVLKDGSKVVYDESGAGSPAIIMVHGLTGGRWYYEKDLPVFSKEHWCIAPDLVGHGDSDKPLERTYSVAQYAADIEEISLALDLKKFILMGHSMGGMIAQTYALDRNADGRCVGLILISTAAALPLRDVLAQVMKNDIKKYEDGTWRFNEQGERAMAKMAWSSNFIEAHPKELDRSYGESRRVPDIIRMRLLLALSDEFDERGRAGNIKLPTLVCVGTEDVLGNGARELAETITGATFNKFPGAGHMINLEIPGLIQKEFQAFLDNSSF